MAHFSLLKFVQMKVAHYSTLPTHVRLCNSNVSLERFLCLLVLLPARTTAMSSHAAAPSGAAATPPSSATFSDAVSTAAAGLGTQSCRQMVASSQQLIMMLPSADTAV